MKLLFIGGTGTISTACSRLALDQGADLYLLNRGRSGTIDGATSLQADIRQPEQVLAALGDHRFDAVVDWVAFTAEHVETDIELFADRTRQYVFISSASAYHKPVINWPITESTPLHNPWWAYSRNKIACEQRLMAAYHAGRLPVTIVRPSHTYGQTAVPAAVAGMGCGLLDRMRQGKPVIVHGDGTSLWTVTHSIDFARAFNALLGHPAAIGEAFHITSDQWQSWNQIYHTIAEALDVEPKLVHIPSHALAGMHEPLGGSLLGDKAHCAIFDNTRIKRFAPGWAATIPFHEGIRMTIDWYDHQPADIKAAAPQRDELMDELIAQWQRRGNPLV